MSKNYEVVSRREVPLTLKGSGLFTGKKFEETPNHAGKKAVCVKRRDGFMAWGFASSWKEAERAAAVRAARLAA